MNKINQSLFWKVCFFISSVSFAGLFLSLPASVVIVALVHIMCVGRNYARTTLGMRNDGIIHLPIGALNNYRGLDLNMKDIFSFHAVGATMGLLATVVFSINFVVTQDPHVAEIIKIMALIGIANILPLPFFDGIGMVRATFFSDSRFLGYLSIIIALLITSVLCQVHWLFLFLFVVAYHDFFVWVFFQPQQRPMKKKDIGLAIAIYLSLLAIFTTIYIYFSEFTLENSLDSFILSSFS